MFGLNDNNAQTTKNEVSATADSVPAAAQPNPFADAAVSTDPAQPPTPPIHPSPAKPAVPLESAVPAATAVQPVKSGDLLELKEQALTSLQPLVSHLDQSPEEKFKTTMMLIQATDNPDLVKEAYQAASQITDDKARAQALLDVVNEINYFTQRDEQK